MLVPELHPVLRLIIVVIIIHDGPMVLMPPLICGLLLDFNLDPVVVVVHDEGQALVVVFLVQPVEEREQSLSHHIFERRVLIRTLVEVDHSVDDRDEAGDDQQEVGRQLQVAVVVQNSVVHEDEVDQHQQATE